jgi:hypothetical protein
MSTPILCANCGRIAYSRGSHLCQACYDYLRKRGRPRPQHLWRRTPNEPCECGRPSIVIVYYTILTVQINQELEETEDCQPLCRRCLRLFQEDERPGTYRIVYGSRHHERRRRTLPLFPFPGKEGETC